MGQLRIIAGELRGRRIEVSDRPGLRPTPARVREALFSILGDRVRAARLVDAYSGTGAIGFEALSRGADRVTFVESDPRLAAQIRRTAQQFRLIERCELVTGRVVPWLASPASPSELDLLIADPPYGSEEGARLLETASRRPLLDEGGWIVLEQSVRDPELAGPAPLQRFRLARYGESRLAFYASSPPGS